MKSLFISISLFLFALSVMAQHCAHDNSYASFIRLLYLDESPGEKDLKVIALDEQLKPIVRISMNIDGENCRDTLQFYFNTQRRFQQPESICFDYWRSDKIGVPFADRCWGVIHSEQEIKKIRFIQVISTDPQPAPYPVNQIIPIYTTGNPLSLCDTYWDTDSPYYRFNLGQNQGEVPVFPLYYLPPAPRLTLNIIIRDAPELKQLLESDEIATDQMSSQYLKKYQFDFEHYHYAFIRTASCTPDKIANAREYRSMKDGVTHIHLSSTYESMPRQVEDQIFDSTIYDGTNSIHLFQLEKTTTPFVTISFGIIEID